MGRLYVEKRAPMVRTHITTGNTISLGDYLLEVDDTTKPNSVKRFKPLDLFASATQRDVFQDKRSYSWVSWDDASYRYRGPCHFLVTVGPGSNEPAQPDVYDLDKTIRSRIKSQNLNLAQSLAEYRQTSSMLVSLGTDIVRTFRSLRSGRAFGDFIRALQNPKTRADRALANRWLQYQYGIKPLLSDLYGSAEALASKIRTGFTRHISTSRSVTSWASETGSPVFNVPVVRNHQMRWTGKVRARYTIRDATLKQLSQIGITNPALLAWELIPYSFVFDLIIPIGSFLSSLDALVGTENLIVNRSYRLVRDQSLVGSGFNATRVYTQSYRFSPDHTLTLPRLMYRPSTSFNAVANMVALLQQSLTGRR